MKIKKNYKYLVLWIANFCNLDCIYCYAKKSFDGSLMEWSIGEKALEFLNEDGTLVFAGGEPLLNFSLIVKIYEYLKYRGFKGKVSIQTNGVLIDDFMGKKLSEMDIKVGISLDGVQEVNNFTRGKTKEVINGIRYLEKYEKNVSINCVLTDKSIDLLENFIERLYMFKNINALGLDLLRVVENNLLKVPTQEKIYMNLKKTYEKSLFLGGILGKYIAIREIEDSKLRLEKNYESCNYCYSSIGETLVILPNGDTYPCSSLVNDSQYFMGNILEGELKDIKLSSGKYEFCKTCEHKRYCRGACPSRLIINERVLEKEGDCNLRKAVFKIIKN
ncbi:radical SAM protein [uncultured Cetobacterium sp.]|uniref:radical SAM/SPASM domain-containing protein n=1 Tax=uncultured Cetobacterium sp. TaxID=527638 RepID=UPI00260F1E6A|nr:radical SAM protein [uncultured Cetobacterium sp.]